MNKICMNAAIFGLLILFVSNNHSNAQDSVVQNVPMKIKNRIQDQLAEIHSNSGFPGCSFSVVLPDKSTLCWTTGLASKEDNHSMKDSDRLMSGSIGKTYFAAIALDLIRQKKLTLDDKVSAHLGDNDWFKRIPNHQGLTIAALMRHQSGLPRYIQNRKLWTDIVSDPNKQWRQGDQLSYIFDDKPLHKVGDGWAYSDTNYILLGLVLESVSKQNVYTYVEETFLKPNQLTDTIPNNRRKIPGLIQGYTNIFQPFGIPEHVIDDGKFVFNPAMEWCGGGYANTSSDLAKWAHLLLSGDLLEGAYVDTMTSNAADANPLGADTKYGLGVMIRKTKAGELLGHDGVFPGYTSTTGYFPKHKIAAAFMFNSDGQPALNRPAHEVLVELVEIVVAELSDN